MSFGRRLPITFVTTLFVLGAGLLSGVLVARSLGVSGRGSWVRSYLPLTIVAWLGTLGVEEALSVLGVASPALAFRRAVRVLALLAVPFTLLAAVGIVLLGRQPVSVALIVAMYVPAYSLYRVAQSALLLASSPSRWNVSRAIAPAAYTAALVILALVGNASVTGTLYSLTLSGWVTALASTCLLFDRERQSILRRVRTDEFDRALPGGAELLKFGMKIHLAGMAMVVNWRFDQLLLAQLASSQDLGLYSVAASVSFLPVSVGAGESEGSISSLARAARDGTLSATVRRLYRRIFATAGVAALLLMALCPILLPAVYGSGFGDAVASTEVLLLGAVGLLFGLPAVVGLRAVRAPGLLAVSELSTALLAVVLLPWVLSSWGIVGVAWLSSVLYTIKSLMQVCFLSAHRRRLEPPTVLEPTSGSTCA